MAIETVWTFDGNGNWTDATSWSGGEPVDESYDVIIDDGSTAVTVTLSQSRSIAGLEIGPDDALVVESQPGVPTTLNVLSGIANEGNIDVLGGSDATEVVPFVVEIGDVSWE